MTASGTQHSQPASTFGEATGRVAEMVNGESERAVPSTCRTTLLHHGRPTSRVLVLFHGYTDCPLQFSGVAALAHEAGLNVFSPLAPEHGRADADARPLGTVTAGDLAQHVTRVMDTASGLGDTVIVAGLSFGGVCAAWAARHRDEVSEAMMIAPSFAPLGTAKTLVPLLPALSRALPERLIWWDPVRREEHRFGTCSYSQFSRRGIGEVFAFGLGVTQSPARRRTPLQRVVLVLNAADAAISAASALHAFRQGLVPLAEDAHLHRYPASLLYPHDFVHPDGLNRERAAGTWPELLGMLDIGVKHPARSTEL